MPDHAAFAVAITIRERVLNDSLLMSYLAHRMVAPVPDDPPNVFVDFFHECPLVQLREDDQERFIVLLNGWGPLTISWDGSSQVRTLRWTMRLLLHARFVVAGSQMEFAPNPDDVTLDAWSFDVLSGGP